MLALTETLSGLTATRDFYFRYLLWSSCVVALGVVLEGPEVIYEARKVLRRVELPARRWITLVSLTGWLFVVLGVLGEGISEALVSRADGNIEAFNQARLAQVTIEAGEASLSAQEASLAAGDAEKKAKAAGVAAGDAQEKADTVIREAGALSTELQRQSRGLNSISPRAVVLFNAGEEVKGDLRKLGSQNVKVALCGGPRSTTFPERDLLEIISTWDELEGILKSPGELWEKCKASGIEVFVSSGASTATKSKALNLFNELKSILPEQTAEVVVDPQWPGIGRFPESPYTEVAQNPQMIVVLVGEMTLPHVMTKQ